METSSIEIGSSATRIFGLGGQGPGDDDALALPAGELVRELVQVLVGRGEADRLQQLGRPGRGPAAVEAEVVAQRPGERVGDRRWG